MYSRQFLSRLFFPFLLPANEVCEGYVFTGVCLSTGGHAWQRGGMHWGACVVGACMVREACVAEGCVHGRGMHGGGGMHGREGYAWQGECMAGGAYVGGCGGASLRGRYYEIRSMSGRYASYWNAFLYLLVSYRLSSWRLWWAASWRN